jgi:hypothetical protein
MRLRANFAPQARVVAAFTAATISPWNKEGVEQKAAGIAARAKADLALVEHAGSRLQVASGCPVLSYRIGYQ